MSNVISTLKNQGVRPFGITADSRKVEKGSLFLAYAGEHTDGRNFIAQAISQGAAAVLWQRDGFQWNPQWQLANLGIDNLRAEAGNIAGDFYGVPSKALWMIGVTGTNGKTSCSHWLGQAFNHLGRKTAVIGTLGNGFPNSLSAAINTTPDPILLHGMLADYLKQGANAVVMEVSSHGLDQDRVNGVHFDIALFTNLSRDHLDYHGEMAAYAAAKKKLFDWEGLGCAVLNSDDVFGKEVAEDLIKQGKQVVTYGLESGEVRGSELNFSEQGISMHEVVVTSDNPRSENPAEIISAIVAGMRGDYQVEPDRAAAIARAINAAKPGDVVLVAGKGHEEYQEIAGVKHPFSDQQIVRQALQQYRSGEA